jgi:hypothetical protein
VAVGGGFFAQVLIERRHILRLALPLKLQELITLAVEVVAEPIREFRQAGFLAQVGAGQQLAERLLVENRPARDGVDQAVADCFGRLRVEMAL